MLPSLLSAAVNSGGIRRVDAAQVVTSQKPLKQVFWPWGFLLSWYVSSWNTECGHIPHLPEGFSEYTLPTPQPSDFAANSLMVVAFASVTIVSVREFGGKWSKTIVITSPSNSLELAIETKTTLYLQEAKVKYGKSNYSWLLNILGARNANPLHWRNC